MVISANANELDLTANRYLTPRIIARSLSQASKELLGDSSVSTVMLMLIGWEYGSGCTEPINTNVCVCVLGDANKKQQYLRATTSHRDRSEGQIHKAPTLREVDSGSFVHTTSTTTTRYDTYSCVCVLISINPFVTAEKYIHHRSASISCVK